MTVKTEKPTKKSTITASESSNSTANKGMKANKEKSTVAAKSQINTSKKSSVAKTTAPKKDAVTESSSAKSPSTTTAKKTSSNKSTAAKSKLDKQPTLSDYEKMALIEKTAYFIAEERGFTQGDPMQDWLVAETRVNQMIMEGNF